jgi:hypothetical protein
MNDPAMNVLKKACRVGRVIWKLYGLAWLIVTLPIVFYTVIAETLTLSWLYFAFFGVTGGAILLVVAILIAVFHRNLGVLIQRNVVKSFNTSRKLVVCEALLSSCILLTAALLHLPLSPLWYGLASLTANSLLEGRWGVSLKEPEEPRKDGKPDVVLESLIWFWFVAAFLLTFACWFSSDDILKIPLLISNGMLCGSFLEVMRKYILQVYQE